MDGEKTFETYFRILLQKLYINKCCSLQNINNNKKKHTKCTFCADVINAHRLSCTRCSIPKLMKCLNVKESNGVLYFFEMPSQVQFAWAYRSGFCCVRHRLNSIRLKKKLDQNVAHKQTHTHTHTITQTNTQTNLFQL